MYFILGAIGRIAFFFFLEFSFFFFIFNQNKETKTHHKWKPQTEKKTSPFISDR